MKPIKLFKVEVGVFLPETHDDYNDYSQVYDKQHAYYDENTIFFLGSAISIRYALAYVINGNVNTYAIVKCMTCNADALTNDDLKEIREHGIFEGWQDFFEGENWDASNVILDLYKSEEKTIKYDFLVKK